MRVAALDIGTNSTRLLVAETDGRMITKELCRRTVITRLGQGVHATAHLRPDAVERTLETLKEYMAIVADYEVDGLKAVATSAVRDAENASDLLIPAFEIIKKVPETIAGEAEAALTYKGVLAEQIIRNLGASFLVIDIGGGSTEIVFGDQDRPRLLKSLPLGCVRLTETFFGFDPPPFGEVTAVRLYVRRILGDNFSSLIGVGAVPLAVAGTPTSLTAVELELQEYDRDQVHGHRLTRAAVIKQLDALSSLPLAERQQVKGLEPERADVIVAGAAILLEIMTFFNFDHVWVSECDILDGVALSVPE